MGVEQNFRIGPYLKCIDQGMPQTSTVRFCPTDASHKSGDQPFCSFCGSAITEQFQTFPGKLARSVSSGDISNEVDSRLVPLSELGERLEDYWVSNLLNDGVWDLNLEMYQNVSEEINPEIIPEGIARFTEFFAPELGILKKHYASVEVCWGVLGWCS